MTPFENSVRFNVPTTGSTWMPNDAMPMRIPAAEEMAAGTSGTGLGKVGLQGFVWFAGRSARPPQWK